MDGDVAIRRSVTVSFDETYDQVLIRDGDTILARWHYANIRAIPDQARRGQLRLANGDARLIVADRGFNAALRRHARYLWRAAPAPGQLRLMMLWAAGAVASVAVIVLVIVPALANTLAPAVPVDRERQLADAAMEQIGWFLGDNSGTLPVCETPEGSAALDKMTARLMAHVQTPYSIDVGVLDHEMINAFALPGGRVLLFDGLLQEAGTAEEIAGVLAHEIGHVVHRDPTRLALQSAGTVGVLGLLLGDFSGGSVILLVAEQVVQASHSQSAETSADAFAIRVMGDAQLPASALGSMFDRFARLGGEQEGHGEGGLLSHLASHPDTLGRARMARQGDRIGDGEYEPVLSDAEWQALKGICGDKSRAKTRSN